MEGEKRRKRIECRYAPPAVAGAPVYLAMALDAHSRLKLKPQNLLLNLPLAQTQ